MVTFKWLWLKINRKNKIMSYIFVSIYMVKLNMVMIRVRNIFFRLFYHPKQALVGVVGLCVCVCEYYSYTFYTL